MHQLQTPAKGQIEHHKTSKRPRALSSGGLLVLLLTIVAMSTACSSASKMMAKQKQFASMITDMEIRAYRCAPKEYALAASHTDLAEWEISQGEFNRAQDHLSYASKFIEVADKKSEHLWCTGDRDGDGLPDEVDQCPDTHEVANGFPGKEGCPDRDGDSLIDREDQCPDEPEDFDGDKDEDGCPDLINDKDGDGILDEVDKCPEDPEDQDGFEDTDGCPEPDNDKDKLCDAYVKQRKIEAAVKDICKGEDQCPNDPEDYDGFEDEDGCSDPDNDNDKILDKDDKCPDDPEDYNGREDEDGCPEVSLGDGRLNITEEVYFATGKTKVLAKSSPLLDDIAGLLNKHPDVRIRVEGHTDDKGSSKSNLKLSKGRAKSVRDELSKRGVDSSRLGSVGYGEDRPKVKVKKRMSKREKKEARALNRRVEFIIVD